jgi:hypothetical protein
MMVGISALNWLAIAAYAAAVAIIVRRRRRT